MSTAQKVTDEFVEYLIKNDKTKLSMDEMFNEFENSGYWQKCKDNLPQHLAPILLYWDDNSWKLYIWNYVKIHLDVMKMQSKIKSLQQQVNEMESDLEKTANELRNGNN